ncbi:hypothetical protein WME91_10345 [Sorangium sp. So ce269]
MQHASQLVRSVYDRIAERYDDWWGRHMRLPQDRLTAGLGLVPGARCVDLGCGTGSELLQRGGLCSVETWTHRFRLWFGSGAQVAGWLQESGFVTHAALREFPPEVLQPLCAEFAARLEVYREPEGIPLDFELAGVIAARP